MATVQVCHAPAYLKPDEVEVIEVSAEPIIRFIKPKNQKTAKIPIAVLAQPMVGADIDGNIGCRYPYREFDFIAQRDIGLVRGSFEGSDPSKAELVIKSIECATKREENGGTFLIMHSFAAMWVAEVLKQQGSVIKGIVLINPFWELTLLDKMTMAEEDVPKDKPMLIIGSEFDPVVSREQFEKWKQAAPQADSLWLEKVDHLLMDADAKPEKDEDYEKEAHVNESALLKIVDWINAH